MGTPDRLDLPGAGDQLCGLPGWHQPGRPEQNLVAERGQRQAGAASMVGRQRIRRASWPASAARSPGAGHSRRWRRPVGGCRHEFGRSGTVEEILQNEPCPGRYLLIGETSAHRASTSSTLPRSRCLTRNLMSSASRRRAARTFVASRCSGDAADTRSPGWSNTRGHPDHHRARHRRWPARSATTAAARAHQRRPMPPQAPLRAARTPHRCRRSLAARRTPGPWPRRRRRRRQRPGRAAPAGRPAAGTPPRSPPGQRSGSLALTRPPAPGPRHTPRGAGTRRARARRHPPVPPPC